MEDEKQALEKISAFWRKSLKYYGKEIALDSNQYFSINQICNDDNLQKGIYDYKVQYGFPQSGCITLGFSYKKEDDSFLIDKITVYAPPADKEFIVASFAPQADFDELSVSMNFGLDMGTKKHTSCAEISQNPNALNMLDFAIEDLEKAQVLGECRLEVPAGSEQIPICHSTNKPLNKEKR